MALVTFNLSPVRIGSPPVLIGYSLKSSRAKISIASRGAIAQSIERPNGLNLVQLY